jgi:hypothetical protein
MIPRELKAVVDAQIPVGASRRVVHDDCSDGKDAALSVKRVAEGYVFNCFRCGYKGFVGNRKLPAAQILRMVNNMSVKPHMEVEDLSLPEDMVLLNDQADSSVPIEAFQYLWEGGITDRLMKRYDFGWSDSFQRVIIPIRDEEGTLLAWLGRDPYYDKDKGYSQAKYILRKQKGVQRRVYFTCHNTKAQKVVFVEDVLSAIRVHEATELEAVALLTTSVGSDLLREYMAYDIVIWLDPGKLADMVGLTARCQSYGINCKFISTAKDPKAYNNIGIREQFNLEYAVKGDNNEQGASGTEEK